MTFSSVFHQDDRYPKLSNIVEGLLHTFLRKSHIPTLTHGAVGAGPVLGPYGRDTVLRLLPKEKDKKKVKSTF